MGIDLTALFGTVVPKFVTFLAETRSSSSTSSTLSDFAFGSVITVNTHYTVKPGLYSNVVTAYGKDPTSGTIVTATNANYHFGVTSGPQLLQTPLIHPTDTVTALTAAELGNLFNGSIDSATEEVQLLPVQEQMLLKAVLGIFSQSHTPMNVVTRKQAATEAIKLLKTVDQSTPMAILQNDLAMSLNQQSMSLTHELVDLLMNNLEELIGYLPRKARRQ